METTPSSPHGVSPPAPATWDFFLSHAGCDSAITAYLDEALIRLGCKPWFDKRCLVNGDSWGQVFPAMMAASKIVVVLVSSATRDAYYQDSEIGRAIDLVRAFPGRYRVIAVLMDMHAPIARIELPFGLERTSLLSWAECGSVDAVAIQLVEALEGAAPEPTIAELPMDATAAFVGETAWGPLRPVVLTRWSEFESAFGPPLTAAQSFLAPAVKGFFDNGGQRAYVVRVSGRGATLASVAIPTADPMQHLIVQARHPGALGNRLAVALLAGARRGLRARLSIDRGQRIVEDRDNLSIEDDGANSLLRCFNGQSAWVGLRWSAVNRPAAMPVAGEWLLAGGNDEVVAVDDLLGGFSDTGSLAQAAGLVALEQVPEAALLCLPDAVHPRFSDEDQARLTQALVSLAERRSAVALVALPRSAQDGVCPQAPGESSHALALAPWVTIYDAAAAGRSEAHFGSVAVPAVGHVAGLLARHDTTQGLHRSPSGAEVLGLCGSGLDPASTGRWTVDDGVRRGVNFLLPDGAGGPIRVRLGSAVTCAIDETWTRLEVRRTVDYVSRRWHEHMAWTQFAPNSEATWVQVRQEADDFFTALWRAGVLTGSRPEEAFFVACGLDTVTQNDIDAGRLVVEIGLALAPGLPHPELEPLRVLPSGPAPG